MQWAMSRDALARVPSAPFDMRRTIRQQWVPLAADGSFTAKLKASTPNRRSRPELAGASTPAAAGAVNAAQELSVPVSYSTPARPQHPETRTRRPGLGLLAQLLPPSPERSQGTVYGTDGAGVDDQDRLTFTRTGGEVLGGTGTLRFRGTIVAFTKFHLLEIALADPIITVRGGKGVLSMRVDDQHERHRRSASGRPRRRRSLRNRRRQVGARRQVTFRPGIRPEVLALLSMGAASPLDLNLS